MSEENKKKITYTFFPLDPNRPTPSARRLLCPKCHELLHRSDIEEFSKCPYCDEVFPENNTSLEDFFLDPLAEEWIQQQQQLFQTPPSDPPNEAFFS